ncbi:hypothetical protein Back11_03580 [Paenibacillus baekrokdamisoli]|uniref:Copper amine oxidase-like N-terminal domain-containing protein n=1 Tax=Paenibacillus baekrokdamisoli TaxID=1712516 RepID=A0A3G9J2U0_9BACL|nr:copper amine oxidase N-terminal domain-containing protein [Paenibacillus baekrokdamisoli]MBB3067805.1 hypothetical protein [Paenibacillus baekrokdamisoli]BBH19013.1 hypothetical protein Back11_03580 [Paenibacillus baekrokdamisoli]
MKKILFVLVLALGLLSLTQAAAASTSYEFKAPPSEVEVNVNGEFIAMDVHPIVENNRTFLPIRTLSSLKLSYSWNAISKVAIVQNKDGDELKITVNNKTAYKNKIPIEIEAPAKSKDGRVLVPIRFVTEALGYHVQYDSIRNIVFITSEEYKLDSSLLEQADLKVARKAAISLPITSNFKPLEVKTYKDHSYLFPGGKANIYIFYDGYTNSVIEIKDGKAILAGQWITSPKGDKNLAWVGTITEFDNPALEPLTNTRVKFSKIGDVIETYYWNDGKVMGPIKNPSKVYSDIIQQVPDSI